MGIQTTQVWQAGYPPPEAAERFEKLHPGAFNRMLTMAEKAQDASIAQTNKANDYRHGDIRRAHLLGGGIAGFALAAGLVVALVTQSALITGLFLSVPVFSVIVALFRTVTPAANRMIRPAGKKTPS